MDLVGIEPILFLECQRRGLLRRAFGVEAPHFIKYGCALLNFSRDRVRWRRKFYMDVCYRRSLTSQIAKRLNQADFEADFLQLGAMYDVPSIVRRRSRCLAYADSNFATSLKSPYFPSGISRRSIDRILAYEKDVYAGLDMIFTMSEYLRRSYIDDFGVDPRRVVHIGAGCNLEELPAGHPGTEGSISRVPGSGTGKDYDNGELLFIGADFERKGGPHLLRAFSVVRQRVPRATLHIVGPPKPSGESAPRALSGTGSSKKKNPPMPRPCVNFSGAPAFS